MIVWQYIACLVVGYLMGSIPFGYLVARRTAKVDVRAHGSGKTGTTNVLRTAGIRAAAIVVTGDLLKGVLAVGFAGVVLGKGYLAGGGFGFGLPLGRGAGGLAAGPG
nr:glycerol-3-phosphate acyltransferase [Dehalococcoidia bacterium]